MLQHAPRACPSPDRDGFGPRDSSGGNFSSTSSNASGSQQSRGPVGLDAGFRPSAPRCRSATDFARRFAWAASHSPPPSPHNISVELRITVENQESLRLVILWVSKTSKCLSGRQLYFLHNSLSRCSFFYDTARHSLFDPALARCHGVGEPGPTASTRRAAAVREKAP